MKFYQLDSNELQKELETDFEVGLDKSQVKSRQRICGYNTQASKPKFSLKSLNLPFLFISIIIAAVYLIFAVFNKSMTYVFYSITAAVLALICQAVIFALKYALDKAIYSLSFNKPYTLTVLRDGVKCKVKYSEIVYGDIVFVEKGDYIPFDAIILSSNGLVTDESKITNNDRVPKHPGVILKENVKPNELSNTVFCDSFVVHGKAKVVVTDVCSRVYVSKSGKSNKSSVRISSKTVDISTLFLTIFSLFCIIFTIICGLISKDYVGIVTAVLLFAIVIISGFMKTASILIYKKAFLNLNKNGVFLKSYTDIDSLNNTDILLLNNSHIFDDKAEISGFISESLEYMSLADIAKNNFSVFLYAAFSLDIKSSVLSSCVKILKKIGIDYNDFNTMCPTLASLHDDNTGVSITAKAYEGNNMLIASGDYSIIKSMCTNAVADSEIEKLNFTSTEMLAVAIKNVDAISDDLSGQTSGFTLIGVLGINRTLEKTVAKNCELLNDCGIHPIVLFTGNSRSVHSTFCADANCVSINDIEDLRKTDFEKIDYICDFSGDIDCLLDKLASVGLFFSHFGEKSRHKRSIAFKSTDNKPFSNKDADVLISDGFKSIFNSFVEAKKSEHIIKSLFINFSLFCAFYVICGVLFSLLYKAVLVNTLAIALLLWLILPMSTLSILYTGISNREISRDVKSAKLIGNNSLSYAIVTSIMFLLLCTVLKFICSDETSSAFLLIAFVAYICFSFDYLKEKPIFSVLSFLPALFVLLIFASPLSFLFNYSAFNVLSGIIALVLGVLLKLLAKFISRSVKI